MNMNLYNRELQDGYILKRIELYKEAASYAPIIIKVLQNFDHKMYNCRLEKALQDAAPRRIYTEKRYQNINIYYYVNSDSFTLASIKITDLIDGKRIPAQLFIESARKRQEYFLKEAYELQSNFDNIDNILNQLEQIKNMYRAITKNLPSEFCDTYRINHYI